MSATALSSVSTTMPESNTLAFAHGSEVSVSAALDEAAKLISAARQPLVVLSCDSSGVIAALDLAETCGAVIEVAESNELSHEIREAQSRGGYWTTQREAFARADVVLTAGGQAGQHPLTERLRGTLVPVTGARRTILNISEMPGQWADASLTSRLTLLSALVRPDRKPAFESDAFADARAFADRLTAARFGVLLWSPRDLDSLDVAAMMNLLDNLNRTTRFTSLALRAIGNAWGAGQLTLARWGVPPRARWVNGLADYDPWRYSLRRLLQSGEADAVIYVSSFPGQAIELPYEKTICLAPDARAQSGVIAIETAIAGLDHSGAWYDEARDSFMNRPASAPSAKPSAAQRVNELMARLPGGAR